MSDGLNDGERSFHTQDMYIEHQKAEIVKLKARVAELEVLQRIHVEGSCGQEIEDLRAKVKELEARESKCSEVISSWHDTFSTCHRLIAEAGVAPVDAQGRECVRSGIVALRAKLAEDAGYEGKCQACDIPTMLNDIGLCNTCAAKLERDLLRKRDWAYAVTAFGHTAEAREELRRQVIAQYGEVLELIEEPKDNG